MNILTSYFTSEKHPQYLDSSVIGVLSDGCVKDNSDDYMGNWYNSSISNNLSPIIFYDSLSLDFIKNYQAKFIEHKHNGYTLNDSRFFAWRNYIGDNYNACSEFIALTDCSDVEVIRNPEEFIKNRNEFLFCGGENKKLGDYISCDGSNYLSNHINFNWNNLNIFKDNNFDLINAGVIVGRKENILKFLDLFCEMRITTGFKKMNINMMLVNYCARVLFGESILVGEPITSKYKKFETDRKDVYFRHK